MGRRHCRRHAGTRVPAALPSAFTTRVPRRAPTGERRVGGRPAVVALRPADDAGRGCHPRARRRLAATDRCANAHGGERMTTLHANTDRREISKFDALASRWWDPQGEFRTLHQINPLRLDYIERRTGLKNHKVLDVGCGGGLLAEAMAARGAAVTGIDMAEESLAVARLHLHESGLQVDYRKTSAESLAAEAPAQFDVVTCMEMLEHVPDPESIVRACATLVSPGGQVFFSTLNRKPKAFLLAILAAEYALRLVPRGTQIGRA